MNRSREIVKVSVVGILANLVLVAFKAFVGLISGSIAVILDAVNNLSDALSSVITIVGTKLAGKAPDKKHPYGYGRIENISSVTIAVIVLLAGLAAFKESVEKIIHPEAADYGAISLIIIAAAVIVKLLLGRYVKGQGEKLNSQSLVASGSDALFDAVISASTLVAAAISLIFHVSIEGWLGAIISIIIVKSGVEILMESLNSIIGERVDSELSGKLKEYVNGFEDVRGAYDLSLHQYGPEKIIGSVHVEVPDDMTARQIHQLTRQITEGVIREFGILLTVGIYASNTGSDFSSIMRRTAQEIAQQYPAFRQLHGFYLEQEEKRVSFDLVLDFGCDAEGIRDAVLEEMRRRYPDYTFSAVLDTYFSD